MEEIWDIYDENRKKTGKTCRRGVEPLEEGEYHIVVTAIILNTSNEILISKRAEHKKFPLKWECTGGSIKYGETSLEGILREVSEELGLVFTPKDAILLKKIQSERGHDFKDLWLFKKDINIEEITFPDGEAIESKWVTIDEFEQMYNRGEIVPTVDFTRIEYENALNKKQRDSYQYIGKKVKVHIDRKLGSKHPKYNYIYPLNYGYIENTISGDGEELDCYILGIDIPIDNFFGKCIAVVHRTNDDDDKLIIVPDGTKYTDKEISEMTKFQEKYFESEIIR